MSTKMEELGWLEFMSAAVLLPHNCPLVSLTGRRMSIVTHEFDVIQLLLCFICGWKYYKYVSLIMSA